MRKDIENKKDWIITELKSGRSQRSIALELNCKVDTLKIRLKRWGVSHLKNQPNKNKYRNGSRTNVYKHLHKNSTISSSKLKQLLWEFGLKEKKCENCNLVTWNNKPAPLELDHINGDNWDNRIENLRILCANCHVQTPTNAGKNSGKTMSQRGGTVYTADLESVPERVASSNLAVGTKNEPLVGSDIKFEDFIEEFIVQFNLKGLIRNHSWSSTYLGYSFYLKDQGKPCLLDYTKCFGPKSLVEQRLTNLFSN